MTVLLLNWIIECSCFLLLISIAMLIFIFFANDLISFINSLNIRE